MVQVNVNHHRGDSISSVFPVGPDGGFAIPPEPEPNAAIAQEVAIAQFAQQQQHRPDRRGSIGGQRPVQIMPPMAIPLREVFVQAHPQFNGNGVYVDGMPGQRLRGNSDKNDVISCDTLTVERFFGSTAKALTSSLSKDIKVLDSSVGKYSKYATIIATTLLGTEFIQAAMTNVKNGNWYSAGIAVIGGGLTLYGCNKITQRQVAASQKVERQKDLKFKEVYSQYKQLADDLLMEFIVLTLAHTDLLKESEEILRNATKKRDSLLESLKADGPKKMMLDTLEQEYRTKKEFTQQMKGLLQQELEAAQSNKQKQSIQIRIMQNEHEIKQLDIIKNKITILEKKIKMIEKKVLYYMGIIKFTEYRLQATQKENSTPDKMRKKATFKGDILKEMNYKMDELKTEFLTIGFTPTQITKILSRLENVINFMWKPNCEQCNGSFSMRVNKFRKQAVSRLQETIDNEIKPLVLQDKGISVTVDKSDFYDFVGMKDRRRSLSFKDEVDEKSPEFPKPRTPHLIGLASA